MKTIYQCTLVYILIFSVFLIEINVTKKIITRSSKKILPQKKSINNHRHNKLRDIKNVIKKNEDSDGNQSDIDSSEYSRGVNSLSDYLRDDAYFVNLITLLISIFILLKGFRYKKLCNTLIGFVIGSLTTLWTITLFWPKSDLGLQTKFLCTT